MFPLFAVDRSILAWKRGAEASPVLVRCEFHRAFLTQEGQLEMAAQPPAAPPPAVAAV